MKKILIAAAVMAFAMSASAQSSYPGSAWANMTVNPSVVKNSAESDNVLLQGRVEQGMIVGHVGNFRVNTFGAVNYSVDRNGLDYNNKIAPMVGVKMQRDLGSNGIVEFGVQAVHERHFRGVTGGPSTGTGVQAFVSVWSGWDLKK
jgi:opacity protein-like surface antigen